LAAIFGIDYGVNPIQLPTSFRLQPSNLSNAQEQVGAEDFPNFVLAAWSRTCLGRSPTASKASFNSPHF
jgi:hypothetical protein